MSNNPQDVLNKFSPDVQEMYLTNPLVHAIITYLQKGVDPYKAIEELFRHCNNMSNDIKKYNELAGMPKIKNTGEVTKKEALEMIEEYLSDEARKGFRKTGIIEVSFPKQTVMIPVEHQVHLSTCTAKEAEFPIPTNYKFNDLLFIAFGT